MGLEGGHFHTSDRKEFSYEDETAIDFFLHFVQIVMSLQNFHPTLTCQKTQEPIYTYHLTKVT